MTKDKRTCIHVYQKTMQEFRLVPCGTDNARLAFLLAFYKKNKDGTTSGTNKDGDVHV